MTTNNDQINLSLATAREDSITCGDAYANLTRRKTQPDVYRVRWRVGEKGDIDRLPSRSGAWATCLRSAMSTDPSLRPAVIKVAAEMRRQDFDADAIISRVQETFGHRIEYANPMAAVRAVCLAWQNVAQERDHYLTESTAISEAKRNQEDEIVRLLREELPDVHEDTDPVEAVRQMAEALAGERARLEQVRADLSRAEAAAKDAEDPRPRIERALRAALNREPYTQGDLHFAGRPLARTIDSVRVLANSYHALMDQRDDARERLREQARADATQDHEITTLRAMRTVLLALIVREGSPRSRSLVDALLRDSEDDYTQTLRGLMLTAATQRDEDNADRLSEDGLRRRSVAMTLWLSEVIPSLSK